MSSPGDPTKRFRARLRPILFVLGAIVVSHLPIWAVVFNAVSVFYVQLGLRILGLTLMAVLPLAVLRRTDYEIRWLPRGRKQWLGLIWLPLLVFILVVLQGGFRYWLGLPRTFIHQVSLPLEWPGPGTILFQATLVIVAAPVAEEFFWRGFALKELERAMPSLAANIVQASLWAFVHFYVFSATIFVAVLGLVFGYWSQRRHCLLPLIVTHILLNIWAFGPDYYHAVYNTIYFNDPLVIDALQELNRARSTPEGRAIYRDCLLPVNQALPKVVPYLGHSDEQVASYAHTMVVVQFGKRACEPLGKLLPASDPPTASEIINLIGAIGCDDLSPTVVSTVMNSADSKVRIAGILALRDLRDVEGLHAIASGHPDARVRQIAARELDHLRESIDRGENEAP